MRVSVVFVFVALTSLGLGNFEALHPGSNHIQLAQKKKAKAKPESGRAPTFKTFQPRPEPRFPIKWHLGSVDYRFKLYDYQVKGAIQKAMRLWEAEAGRSLFQEEIIRGFPIKLVFDHRQQDLLDYNAEAAKIQKLIDRLKEAEKDENEYSSVYLKARKKLDKDIKEYKYKKDDYDTEVDRWNSVGGAPRDVFLKLERERRSLEDDKFQIDLAEIKIRSLRDRANDRVQSYNDALDRYKSAHSSFKLKYDKPAKEVVGECISVGNAPTSLSVFTFNDVDELTLILAHELGHALGIKHVDEKGSLMHPVEEDGPMGGELKLSSDDRAALMKVISEADASLSRPGNFNFPTRSSFTPFEDEPFQSKETVIGIYTEYIKGAGLCSSAKKAKQIATAVITQCTKADVDARLALALLIYDSKFSSLTDSIITAKVKKLRACIDAFPNELDPERSALAAYKLGVKRIKEADGIPSAEHSTEAWVKKVMTKFDELRQRGR